MNITIEQDRKPIDGILKYSEKEYSFQTDSPDKIEGFTSLLVNDLNLEINDEGIVCFVWGLCPHTAWGSTDATPGNIKTGLLKISGVELIPGVSKRINSERWPVVLNRKKGWICIGDVNAQGAEIKFAPGAVAVIEAENLKSLWLQPDEIPKNI